MIRLRTILSYLLALPLLGTAPAPLQVWAIDVEGGAATLIVTPGHHALLIDSGWARRPADAGGESSAQRIAAAARAMGVAQIDFLLTTHYHADHVGGAAELATLIPIGTLLDHGPNREIPPANATSAQLAGAPATFYLGYLDLARRLPRRSLRPGDTLRMDGLTITAVDSDGAVLAAPLAGAGAATAGCTDVPVKSADGGDENNRSLGVVLAWGRARIAALGDTTWNVETRLVCPRNLIGHVDLMIADHHGSELSNNPVFVGALSPRVVVVENGATKGGDAAPLTALRAVAGTDAVWQLHYANRAGEANLPPARIANSAGSPDAHHPLRAAVSANGTIALTNPRSSETRAYPPR